MYIHRRTCRRYERLIRPHVSEEATRKASAYRTLYDAIMETTLLLAPMCRTWPRRSTATYLQPECT
jgi:hypothetical protein